jgi:YVTN family beta-propeller protein
MKYILAMLPLLLSSLLSCSTTMTDIQMPPGTVSKGVYVLNEGNFVDPVGARLSFLDLLTDSVYFDLFEGANNGSHLGSAGDDLVLADGKLYAVMSGSENIVVMDTATHMMIQSATLAGSVPHSMAIDELRGKMYVTQLFAGSVLVLDLTTLAVELTVPTGLNPRGMIIVGDFLFVCNSGYGADKTVTAISTVTNTVVKNIPVGDGPTDVVLGADGNLWVSCTGYAFGSPPSNGSVYVVNPLSLVVVDSLIFPENLWGDISIGSEGTLYLLGVTSGSFYGGPVHRILPASRAIDLNFIPGTFYSLAADIVSNRLYAADVNDFQSDGEVDIYESDGTLVKSFPAQRGPGTMVFRY